MPRFFVAQPLGYSIQTNEIDDGAINNAKINASAAIAYSKLAALTAANILVGNGSNVPTSVTMGGDVTLDNAGAASIGANKVGVAQMKREGSSGQPLTSNGAGVDPSYQDGGGGTTPQQQTWSIFNNFTVIDGTWTYRDVSSAVDVLENQTSGTPLDDEITFPMTLQAGTYTIGIFAAGDTDTGICHVSVGASEKTTLDTYNQGSNAIIENTGITISESGLQTIHLKVASKNAGSSNYRFRFMACYFIRTGA